mgnify:CR=1 FL=1
MLSHRIFEKHYSTRVSTIQPDVVGGRIFKQIDNSRRFAILILTLWIMNDFNDDEVKYKFSPICNYTCQKNGWISYAYAPTITIHGSPRPANIHY